MNKFQNQTAIITGAASGIGLAISKKLISEGAKVILVDKNGELLETISQDLGQNAMALVLDITNETAVNISIAQIVKSNGSINILVNTAGITGPTQLPTHAQDIEAIRQVFEVNFWGALHMTKAILPNMISQNYGRILHIASIAGKEGNPGMLGYSTSKAAIIGMAKAQGKEYAETGITINALAPAVIQTPLVDALPEAQVKYMTDKIPMKRTGTLTEIADLVAFIVSKENSFTTGFCYDLSGGRATY